MKTLKRITITGLIFLLATYNVCFATPPYSSLGIIELYKSEIITRIIIILILVTIIICEGIIINKINKKQKIESEMKKNGIQQYSD